MAKGNRKASSKDSFSAVRAAIKQHGAQILAIPNVIEVRPGYKFTAGWITDQPAIVVTVLRKAAPTEIKPKE